MQACGCLFISLTFSTVSYIYFYDVTDGGGGAPPKQTWCNILMKVSATGGKNQPVLWLQQRADVPARLVTVQPVAKKLISKE